jgi:hypothetical protein
MNDVSVTQALNNDKAPTMKGDATVLHTDAVTEYAVAAWGPNKEQTGGPDFYNVAFTPKDPALAARQLRAQSARGLRAQEARRRPHVRTQRLGTRQKSQAAEIL